MPAPDCPNCPYEHARLVEPEGLHHEKIVVTMCPGPEDSMYGEPNRGPAGEILRELVNGAPVGYTNAVACFPGRGVKGTSAAFKRAIKCCRPRLEDELAGKDVLVLGNEATEAVHGTRRTITSFRGTVTEGDCGTKRAAFSLSPNFVLRQGGEGTDAWNVLKSDVEAWLHGTERVEIDVLVDPPRLKLPPKGTTVVVDIETTGLDPKKGSPLPPEERPNDVGEEPRIRCYGFAWRLPPDRRVRGAESGRREHGSPVADAVVGPLVVAVFTRANATVRRLLDGRYPLVAQNHAFEVKWMDAHLPFPETWTFKRHRSGEVTAKPTTYADLKWADTMLSAHALHEDRGEENKTRPGYRLDALVQDYLPYGWPAKAELLGDYNVLTAPLDVLTVYCGYDCAKELLLHERWEEEILSSPDDDQRGTDDDVHRNRGSHARGVASAIRRRLHHLALPGLRFLDRVETRGMPFNARAAGRVLTELDTEIESLGEKLRAVSEINWNAVPQVKQVFKQLGLKPPRESKTENGSISLDRLGQAELIARNPEHRDLIEMWVDYRKALKTKSDLTGDGGPFKHVDEDGRLHARLSIVGTATGRLSASSPAIHNFHRPLRRCFVAPPGYSFLAADFSGAEIAWAAHYTGDERLVRITEEGRSWHTETSTELDIPRRPAKAVNFGLIYRVGPKGLLAQLQKEHFGEYDEQWCARMIARVRSRHAGLERWARKQQEFAREHGYVVSEFGWVRRLPGAQTFGSVQAEAERQAVNTPIQSAASDATLYRAMEVEAEVPSAEIVLLKHDEILMLVPTKEKKRIAKQVKEIMERRDFYWGRIRVPLRVEFETGKSWGDMKELKV